MGDCVRDVWMRENKQTTVKSSYEGKCADSHVGRALRRQRQVSQQQFEASLVYHMSCRKVKATW